MKSLKSIVFFLLLFSAQSTFAQEPSYFDCVDTLQEWVDKQVNLAKTGVKNKIEMPFVVRSLGWGCLCPDYYIGVSSNTQEGPWISPITPKNFPISDRSGHSLIVTGYFTGKMINVDLRDEEGQPEEWLYTMPQFKITDWRENESDYDVPPPKIVD